MLEPSFDAMKNLLIIYPHWPPSNLAGVHRPRLVANYLSQWGWQPIVLTVDPEYYEEAPDLELLRTVSEQVQVVHVKARPVSKRTRFIGDIGLRAWSNLKKEALRLIEEKQIKFVWIPIPSFYMAILGRVLHNKTRVSYGIDYIDPWVRDISNRKNWRSVLSLKLAELLEPYAVKKASLITGVSENYYLPVLDRNPSIRTIEHLAFPYGFDPNDHVIKLPNLSYPWQEEGVSMPFLYAGAFLPNSRFFIEILFKAVSALHRAGNWPKEAKLYFLGTGSYSGKTIQQYAKDAGIDTFVREKRERFPFLQVLNFLSAAHVVMVIGSTEKHYTASKTFQSILSTRPIFAMMHQESSAVSILEEARAADFTVRYGENMKDESLVNSTMEKLLPLVEEESSVVWKVNTEALDAYTSCENARKLAEKLNQVS